MIREKIKIAVATSQELFRKALVALLQTNAELEVLGDLDNGRALLQHLKQVAVDIVLLDAHIPTPDSTVVLQVIQNRFPATRVIVLENSTGSKQPSDFMKLGANGFLGNNCSANTFFDAFYKVKKEGYFLDSSASKTLLDTVLQNRKSPAAEEQSFSERETDILRRICDGCTNKEIAGELNLSASTVDFYRTRIYQKTKARNAVSLLKYALRTGLISFP